MSSTIDNRIVEMRFENSQFESGISQSMSSIQKLNEALKFKDSSHGLDQISESANKINLDGIGNAVQSVSDRFSTFGIIAMTALQNVVNRAVDAGIQITKALTIQAPKDGFAEYELKMGSIQTIMAGTGESLETVNKYLDELNEYADKTIYSFSDMTESIGKFTNNGVKLEDAVKAIQGISNEAAISGATAQQASHAMYNFAQALSAGYVKLIDWKSIENANMATVEFKNTLLETALDLGTVTKEGDMYVSTTTNAQGKVSDLFNATVGFNDALQSQWMTTEVLTTALAKYTDETTDLGKKAYAAATEIKTFSQMVDTIKEALGTGWATTFETIFGNFEEAKVLWTSIYTVIEKVINKSAEARNKMFERWADKGGRETLIKSIAGMFGAIEALTKPVKQAFLDIFPNADSEWTHLLILNKLTFGFRNLVNAMRPSQETAENIRRTFRGLFAILDIGKQALSALLSPLKVLFSGFSTASGGILSATASLGDFFVELDKTVTKSKFFENIGNNIANIFQKIGGVISNVIGFFKNLAGTVREAAENFSLFDKVKEIVSKIVGDFKNAANSIKNFGSSFKSAFENVGDTKFYDGFKKLFTGLFNFISGMSKAIGEVITNIFGGVFDAIGNADFSKIFALFNAGLVTGFVGLFGDFFIKFQNLFDPIGDIGDLVQNFKEDLAVLQGALRGFSANIDSKTILNIAMAVGILAVSLIALSNADPRGIAMGVGAISTMMGELVASLEILKNSVKSGLGGFFESTELSTLATSMIKIAAAVLILSFATKQLAGIPFTSLVKGLMALTGVMIAVVGSMLILSKFSGGHAAKGALAMIAIAAAVKILAGAIEQIAGIEKNLIKATAVMAGIFLFVTLYSRIAKGGLSAVGQGLSLILIASSMLIFAHALEGLANVEGSMVRALGAMAVILAIVAIYTKISTNGLNATVQGVGLILIATSMLIFAKALEDLATMEGSMAKALGAMAIIGLVVALMTRIGSGLGSLTMGVGLIAIAASMIIFAEALDRIAKIDSGLGKAVATILGIAAAFTLLGIVANFALPGIAALSVGLLAFAVSMAVLAPALAILGGENIGKGLLNLAIALGIFAVAAVASIALAPGMLILSASLIAIGIACLAVGAGMALVGTGVVALAAGLAALATMGSVAALALETIPVVISALAMGIVQAIQVFADAKVQIATCILEMISSFLTLAVQYIPQFVDFIMQLLTALLDALNTYLPDLVQKGVDLVCALMEGFGSQQAQLINSAITMMINFINGLADGIRQNTPAMIVAVNNLMNAAMDAIKMWFSFALLNGRTLTDKIKQGISEGAHRVVETVRKMISDAVNKAKEFVSDFKDAAKNCIDGFINGLTEGISKVVDKAKEIGKSALEGLKGILDINSPSKRTREIGTHTGNGFILGMEDTKDGVKKTSEDLGDTVLKTLTGKMDDTLSMEDLFLKTFDGGMKDLAEKTKESTDETGENLEELADTTEDTMHRTSKATKEAADGVSSGVDKMSAKYKELKKSLTETISGGIDIFKEFSVNSDLTADKLLANMQSQVNGVATWAANLSSLATKGVDEGILNKLSEMGPSGAEYVNAFAQMTSDQLLQANALWTQSLMLPDSAASLIASSFATCGQNISKGLAQGIDPNAGVNEIIVATTNEINAFKEQWGIHSPSTVAYDFGKNICMGLRNGIISYTGSVTNQVQALCQFILNRARSGIQLGTYADIGRNICEGLRIGVVNGSGEVLAEVDALCREIRSRIESAMETHSPSRFTYRIGKYLDQGLANGLSDYTNLVANSAEDVSNHALDTMQETISKIVDAVNGNMDINPVITPSLDISNIRAGAQQISGMFNSTRLAVTNQNEQLDGDVNPTSGGITYNQYNYSPKSLSRIEIYRQTRNQLSSLKGLVNT